MKPLNAVGRGMLLGCLAACWLVASGCGPTTFVVGLAPGDRRVTETVVLNEPGDRGRRVAMIDVSGLITNAPREGLLSSEPNPVSVFAESLRKASLDEDVVAVIVRINSPGGTVTASDLMYRELRRFSETTGKPTVAVMMDVAASGGYYLACGADVIFAHPTTVTGSVGVILQTVSVRSALQKIGVQPQAFTSGLNKDAGSPLSAMTDDKAATLQAVVDDFYEGFLDVVRERRPSLESQHFEQATDGRVVTGVKALEWQLVDRLGDLRDGFGEAKRLAGVERADLVRYHGALASPGSIYANAPEPSGGRGGVGGAVEVSVLRIDGGLVGLGLGAAPGAYYLWTGDLP